MSRRVMPATSFMTTPGPVCYLRDILARRSGATIRCHLGFASRLGGSDAGRYRCPLARDGS
jgi:hypothetical protein